MTLDDLETLLRAWGRAYGARPTPEWQEDSSGTGMHPLAVAAQFAIGKRDKSQRIAWTPTHAVMLAKWAANGFRGRPPAWASEPAAGTPTRSSGARSLVKFDRTFTPELAMVVSAVMDLHRFDDLKACVLRQRYGTRDGDRERASRLKLTPRKFREEHKAALIWMHGRLAA